MFHDRPPRPPAYQPCYSAASRLIICSLRAPDLGRGGDSMRHPTPERSAARRGFRPRRRPSSAARHGRRLESAPRPEPGTELLSV